MGIFVRSSLERSVAYDVLPHASHSSALEILDAVAAFLHLALSGRDGFACFRIQHELAAHVAEVLIFLVSLLAVVCVYGDIEL